MTAKERQLKAIALDRGLGGGRQKASCRHCSVVKNLMSSGSTFDLKPVFTNASLGAFGLARIFSPRLLPQSVVHECAVQDAKGVKLAMAGAHPVEARATKACIPALCPHLNKKPPIWPGAKKTFFRDFADPHPAPSGGMAAKGR